MNNFWTKNDAPTVARTTTTVDPSPPFVNYRATIVPDESKSDYTEDSILDAIQWIRDYAEVNGVKDLKNAIETIEKNLRNIL